MQVWAHRNEVTPDSISYIELAWAGARSGMHQLASAYWSPLYPFLLSLVFRYFHPSLQWEFTAAHILNFAVYLASLAAFELFLKELLIARQAACESRAQSAFIESRILRIWGYVFFLWASYFWLGPSWVTPDLCVSLFVFLATAMLLRIRRGFGGWLLFTALGACLGLGYFAKSAMFPLSFVFLFSAFFLSRRAGTPVLAAALQVVLAGGVFAALALPLIVSISLMKGRFTFGDPGKLNYVEYVNGASRWLHWQGEPPGTGTPVHPTRRIFRDPDVLEFSSPIPGTYPPWYDPSYWYEGARPHFEWKGQLRVLFRSANMYLKIFSKSGALWIACVALFWLFRKKVLVWGRGAPADWLILLPLVAALVMYALVLVEFRYVAPFVLLLLVWTLSKLRVVAGAPEQMLKRFVAITVLAPALAVGWMAARDLKDVLANKPYEPWVVATSLREMGIVPGTEVATIGTGLDAYWAHLAGVRVIAEIPDKDQAIFVAAGSAKKRQILSKFAEVAAKAVVTKNAAVATSMDGWQRVGATHYYIWRTPGN